MSFEQQIRSWVNLDNQIRVLNEKLRDLREQRNETSTEIIQYVETANLNHATVQISDGKLKFMETKQTAPLTLKYINECLQHCIHNAEDVEKIMDHIKNSRSVKVVQDIKRSYAN